MTEMRRRIARLVVLLAFALSPRADGAGKGFGQSLRPLMSARQAATGGIALEDPWIGGALLDFGTVLLPPFMHWLEVGAVGQLSGGLRIGAEFFQFSTQTSAATTENADGSYKGHAGSVQLTEWGVRLRAQYSVGQLAGWNVAVVGRITGMNQFLPTARNAGVALEAGAQGFRRIGEVAGSILTSWVLVGPLGQGASRGFAGKATAGLGYITHLSAPVFNLPAGYGIGAEGTALSEGLPEGGLAGVGWLGDPNRPGATVSLRMGGRYVSGSVQNLQYRIGMGCLWRRPSMLGLQFDYALMPAGELGFYQYVTVTLRFPTANRS